VACHVCGTLEAADADGWCPVCGARRRGAADRVETDLVRAAAVRDRGRVHRRNEDAYAVQLIADGGAFAAVVCDGISSASASDAAARTAADAAVAVLAAAAASGSNARAATVAAAAAAIDAVAEVPWTTRADRGMPSCTLVSALGGTAGEEIVIGSVGDSRAYWVDAGGATRQLTTDDSWAQAQVDAGALSAAAAFADARSHAITRWIGADAPAEAPRLAGITPPGPGRIVLCSDGLWNYLAATSELGQLVARLPAGASAAAVARALTDVAVQRGGRDNITVAVIDIAKEPT
jgi:serine/threonine protein phosphatase PrpC